MIRSRLIGLAVSTMLISTAFAQDNDWAAVMRLKPETTVSVLVPGTKSGQRTLRRVCRLLQPADPDGIHCGVTFHNREWIEDFPRERIKEVRLEYIEHPHGFTGILVGGLIGGAVYLSTALTQGANAEAGALSFVYGAALGAAVGAAAETGCDRRQQKVKHGPVIYRSKSNP